jgi:hypothetical protein
MKTLSDEHLLECYQQAIEWELDEEFIEMLRREIDARNLEHAVLKKEKVSIF